MNFSDLTSYQLDKSSYVYILANYVRAESLW